MTACRLQQSFMSRASPLNISFQHNNSLFQFTNVPEYEVLIIALSDVFWWYMFILNWSILCFEFIEKLPLTIKKYSSPCQQIQHQCRRINFKIMKAYYFRNVKKYQILKCLSHAIIFNLIQFPNVAIIISHSTSTGLLFPTFVSAEIFPPQGTYRFTIVYKNEKELIIRGSHK